MRLLLVCALLCLASPAWATGTGKLLIVYNDNPNICVEGCTPDDAALADSIRSSGQGMNKRGFANLLYQCARFGIAYKVTTPKYIKTEEARIGAITWNRGTSGAVTEEFDALLVFGFDASQPITTGVTFRGDSLWRTNRHITAEPRANGPSVPAGFIFRPINSGESGFETGTPGRINPLYSSNATAAATRCSLGVVGDGQSGTLGEIDGGFGAVPSVCRSPKTGRAWFASANLSSIYVNNGAVTEGSVHPIVQTMGATSSRAFRLDRGGAQVLRPDSLFTSYDGGYGGISDTSGMSTVWERRYSSSKFTGTGSSVYGYPVNVFGMYWGAAPCSDTLTGGQGSGLSPGSPPCEGAPENLLFVLARLDSLTGGVLFDRSKAPIVAAPVVYGAFARSGRRHYYGVSPSDTTSLWATMDSLKAEGIPLTVAANMDSIQTYASEIAQWKKVGNVKFVPWSRSGQAATQTGTVASPTAYRDIWGRVRSRVLYGDRVDWGAANDTSFRALYRYAVDTLKKQVGFNYVTTTAAVALDDDWSPTNAATVANFSDSMAFTLNSLGIRKLVIDAQVTDAYKVAAASRIGWGQVSQGPLSTTSPRANLMLLGHTGYSISGGAFQNDYGGDSTTWVESTCCNGFSSATATNKATNRWITGLIGPENYKDYDYFPYDGKEVGGGWNTLNTANNAYDYFNVNTSVRDYVYPFQRACVLRMGPNDLAGSPDAPVRPAYFALKGLNNMFNALNGMSYGRKLLIRLGTLEEANP